MTQRHQKQQPLKHGVRIGEVVMEYGDVRSLAKHRPSALSSATFWLIIQNSDLVLLHWHPSRSD